MRNASLTKLKNRGQIDSLSGGVGRRIELIARVESTGHGPLMLEEEVCDTSLTSVATPSIIRPTLCRCVSVNAVLLDSAALDLIVNSSELMQVRSLQNLALAALRIPSI